MDCESNGGSKIVAIDFSFQLNALHTEISRLNAELAAYGWRLFLYKEGRTFKESLPQYALRKT